jgi:hypothetical protein
MSPRFGPYPFEYPGKYLRVYSCKDGAEEGLTIGGCISLFVLGGGVRREYLHNTRRTAGGEGYEVRRAQSDFEGVKDAAAGQEKDGA